jgi:glycosyltransferase involved in cell wall biosynthesis
MSSSNPDSALILSPTPPAPGDREFFHSCFGADVSFADLPTLRRASLTASVSELRRRRVVTVVVTGTPLELPLFEDYLTILAFLVPALARRRQLPGHEPSPLRPRKLITSVLRVALGALAGASDLGRAWLHVRRLTSEPSASRRLADPQRCLYLKPLLSFGVSVGGSVAHVAGVVNALKRSGIEVRLLSSHDQPLVEASVEQVEVRPDFMIAFPFEVNQHRYQGVFLRAAGAEAEKQRPDFLYQRYALNDMSGLLLRRRLGVPLVLEFNGSEVWAQRHWGERLRFERLAQAIERVNLRDADLVIAVSQALVNQAIQLGAAAERVLFYPNGIDPSVFDPARFNEEDRRAVRRELGIPESADLLTFVGTFGRWHGTDVLAESIRRLIDVARNWLERQGIHFLYVGDGALAPKVRSILGPGLGAPFVTLAGFRPQTQTPRILAASDILLSPHIPNPDGTPFFGSPTKLFEYMAMARPIVASDLDQIGWVLKGWRPGETPPPADAPRDSQAALLVEPGSVEDLTRGIRQMVELPRPKKDALGQEARRLALQSFTWDKNVAAVLERLRTGGTNLSSGEDSRERSIQSRQDRVGDPG